jgi:hypothetical protein
MTEDEKILEENVKQLLQSGYSTAAQPDPALRQLMFKKIMEARTVKQVSDFPKPVLAGLVLSLGVLFLWLVMQLNRGDLLSEPAVYAGLFVLGVNLVWIPLTGLTIFLIRRFYAK